MAKNQEITFLVTAWPKKIQTFPPYSKAKWS